MCRLFTQLTVSDRPAHAWLLDSERSLLRQSNASPETAQADGWGIAWYEPDGRIRLEKGVEGAFAPSERAHFERASREARGTLIVGHLRHASNPLGLPREKLLALENSQPFHDAKDIFAHNGAIPLPNETRPYLGRYSANVRGVNDSEVLFWLLAHHVEGSGNPLEAYARTVEDLVRVWEANGRPGNAPYSGLNVLFARGPDELWAFCHWKGEVGCGLLASDRPYYEMTYREEPGQLIVGSEPFDGRVGWTNLANGRYLAARREGHRLRIRTGPIPLAASALHPLSPA
ncbi:MAG: class II glutamine amidotransferase [Thermoplasmata archaeon]